MNNYRVFLSNENKSYNDIFDTADEIYNHLYGRNINLGSDEWSIKNDEIFLDLDLNLSKEETTILKLKFPAIKSIHEIFY